MKLLIVEDGPDKQKEIKNVIESKYQKKIQIDVVSTYFSAQYRVIPRTEKKECKENREGSEDKDYFMLIVDMFLPDAQDNDELKGLAGKELIFDMYTENIKIPTLIVTQYTEYINSAPSKYHNRMPEYQFLENPFYNMEQPKQIRRDFDCTYLVGLHEYLCAKIPFYLGILYYSNQFQGWKENLLYFIDKIIKDGKHEDTTIG